MFVLLGVSITILPTESAETAGPRTPAELNTESTHFCDDHEGTTYGSVDSRSTVSAVPTRELPVDCWSRCLDFMTYRDIGNVRCLSQKHNKVCMLRFQRTEQLRPLLSQHRTKFYSMRDIEKCVTLFPGGSLDLRDSRSPRLLHRFHALNGHHNTQVCHISVISRESSHLLLELVQICKALCSSSASLIFVFHCNYGSTRESLGLCGISTGSIARPHTTRI